MGSILLTLFTIILIILSLLLVLVILMQRANANAGMGSAFGSGFSEQSFGAEAGNILTKATIWGAGLFFVLSLGLYLGYKAEFELAKQTNTPQLHDVIKIETPTASESAASATITTTPAASTEAPATPAATTTAPAEAPAQDTATPANP